MRVCLFEDDGVHFLDPLTATRPAFDLLCGQTSLRSKQCRHFAPCTLGALVRPALAELVHVQQPGVPVNDPDWLRAEPVVLVNGRWLPPPTPPRNLGGPCVAMVGEQVAYAVVGPDQLAGCTFETLADCLESWKETLPQRRAGGALIAYPWDLVERNGRQIALDFEQGPRRQPSPDAAPFAVVGPRDQLLVDPTATVEPMVVVDTRGGPVVIEREAVVTAFTRLEGPCYVGPQTHVLGARVRAGTTLGPCCRVGGEVEASILHGYSNKYHDGFLGHSYVGEWVNLGAGTNNSDLRNDYGEVTVLIAGRPVATGQTKVGCFLGDHTKSGLGTLLNTGSNVGAFCNLLPSGAFVSKYLPPFTSWWNGGLRENSDLERLLATAAKVMQRRGCTLTEGHAVVYRSLFEQTAAERKRALREAEQRRFRASA